MSIKNRIRYSLLALVAIFAVNAAVTIVLLNNNNNRSEYIYEVLDPSEWALYDFNHMLLESKMYATNWVFLRSKQDDKDALQQIHDTKYFQLKTKMDTLFAKWKDKGQQDSIAVIYAEFEALMDTEKEIMSSLHTFSDYDNPVKKFQAEAVIEDVVLPQTARLMAMLHNIIRFEQKIREAENEKLEFNSMVLRIIIIILAISIALIALILSGYLAEKIIQPINQMNEIINLLGKGKIDKVRCVAHGDEIGEMIKSVNHLSDKLLTTASFAHEVGLRNFNTHYAPLSDEDILGKSLITMRDNLKNSEDVLQANITELKKSNMELDKFVYSVSHDLRAPLRSILGVIEISEEATTDELLLEHFGMIKGSINRLDGFILDILDYSRNARMEIKKEEINFKEILDDITANLKYMGNNNRKVDIQMNYSNGVSFKSDKSRLAVVLNNLVSNSIRYQNPKEEHPFVKVNVILTEAEAKISVQDNGIGIKNTQHEKIFEMFYRVSSNSVGSGLGLYIVKETIDKLNGHIEVESEPGKGTTMKISIPNNK